MLHSCAVCVAVRRNILTVGVVSTPFQFEGPHRMRLAQSGLAALDSRVDTLIVVPNQVSTHTGDFAV